MLGYLGLLGLVSLLVVFPAPPSVGLPDTFREAKRITLSMFVCSCVWVTFIPTHRSSRSRDTVPQEVSAILASEAGLLFCLFLPKCHIILLQPEKTQKNKCLAGSISSEKISSEQKGVPPAQGCLP